MANLSLIRKQTSQQNDALFGEEVKLVFLDRGAVDKTRPQRIIIAVLTLAEDIIKTANGSTSSEPWHVPIAVNPGRLSIDRKKYPGLVIRQGDKVRAISRQGQPWFKVSSVDERARQRLYINLGQG